MAARLAGYDVASAPRYVRKPAFQCRVFADRRTFGDSHWPFSLARPSAINYDIAGYPGTMAALDAMLVLPLNERYGEEEADYLVAAIANAVRGEELET